MTARRVLLVEDEPVVLAATGRYLEALGHAVQSAADADAARAAAAQSPPEVLVCDCNLSGELDGLALARAIREDCGAAVILVSGHPPEALRDHFDGLEVAACLHKPVSLRELAAAVASAR